MSQTIWDTSGDADRRWTKRKAPSMGIPSWAGLAIVGLGLLLMGTLAWQGGKYLWQRLAGKPAGSATAASGLAGAGVNSPGASRTRTPQWQIDAQAAFRNGVSDASTGNIDGAEMDVDQGAEILTRARERQETPAADFFDVALRTLDLITRSRPESSRLTEHTVLARIELAQLRTMMHARAGPGVNDAGVTVAVTNGPDDPAERPGRKTAENTSEQVIQIYDPISIAANSTYSPAKAHGSLLDATMMAEDAEVLLPPASRLLADGVRVENLTIRGASQTLDGVYWENVTFEGARLRYDGGELSLQNVRFVDCTFGLQPDERGARLATAVALGQNSIVIE